MRVKRRMAVIPVFLLFATVIAGAAFLLWRQSKAHTQETALYVKQIAALNAQMQQGDDPISVYFNTLMQDSSLELDSYAYTTAGMSAQGWAAAQAWKQELEYTLDHLGSGQYPQDQEVKDRFLALAEEEDQLLHNLLTMSVLPDVPPAERDEELWLGSMYSHVSQWRLAGLYAQAVKQLRDAVDLYAETPLEYQFNEAVLEDLREQLFPDEPEVGLGVLPPIADVVK